MYCKSDRRVARMFQQGEMDELCIAPNTTFTTWDLMRQKWLLKMKPNL